MVFLTDEQRQRYGWFQGDPTPEDLDRYFHLDDSDRNLIAPRRGDHNRLGFAVQLYAARFLGSFPEDLAETPATVLATLSRQLSITHRWHPLFGIRLLGGRYENRAVPG